MKQEKPPLTVTVDEAAKLLGISRGLAYQGVHDGSIPSLQIGGRILVPRARLLEMLGETGRRRGGVSAMTGTERNAGACHPV